MSSIMSIKNLQCELHMPNKLNIKKTKSEEFVYSLPPRAPVDAYKVDEYKGCPSSWMNGSSKSSSYFVPIKEGKGMWLDFNNCFENERDVAIVVSIQGINPITGQKTKTLRLEQYKDKCPVHNVEFHQDLFCPKCEYKWPGQNYITTTTTPYSFLWIDGFRCADGKIRQYVFTADEEKGVATQLIGNDKVYAIGIAFYISKESKKNNTYNTYKIDVNDYYWDYYHYYKNYYWPYSIDNVKWDRSIESSLIEDNQIMRYDQAQSCVNNSHNDISYNSSEINYDLDKMKQLDIGAGALIEQSIYNDNCEIDYWKDVPEGMIYINYCDEITCKKILSQGKRKEKENGFLDSLKLSC